MPYYISSFPLVSRGSRCSFWVAFHWYGQQLLLVCLQSGSNVQHEIQRLSVRAIPSKKEIHVIFASVLHAFSRQVLRSCFGLSVFSWHGSARCPGSLVGTKITSCRLVTFVFISCRPVLPASACLYSCVLAFSMVLHSRGCTRWTDNDLLRSRWSWT